MDTIQELKLKKTLYDNAYYNKGEQLITDYEYDILEKTINDVEGCSDEKPNLPKDKKNRIKLPIEMWSLNKKREISGEIEDVIIMDKLDGISCLIYKNKAYTRGDGKHGRDITEIIDKSVFEIFSKYNDKFAIRGELVIAKNNLEKEFSNTRTMVCSYISRLKFCNKINFIAYELITLEEDNDLSPFKQIEFMKNVGLNVVFHEFQNTCNQELLLKILNQRISESEFDIDGIVVNYNNIERKSKTLKTNPKYVFAFKQNFSGVETTVKEIIWNIGKSGNCIPTVIIDEIQIGGTRINKVTGHNKEHLLRNGIGKNAIVEVIKSGQIIPHIIKVIKQSNDINFPTIDDDIDKSNKIEIKKFLYFSKTLNIKGVGIAKSKKFIDMSLDSYKIISEGPKCFDILKNKDKNDEKIISNFIERIPLITQIELLASISAFGEGIGIKKIEKIQLSEYNKEIKELLIKWKTNWNITSTLEAPINEQENIRGGNNIENTTNGNACITGTRSKEFEKKVKELGYTPGYVLNSKTKILYVFGTPKSNKKIDEARKRNIEIIFLSK